jgi:hypothetical protein
VYGFLCRDVASALGWHFVSSITGHHEYFTGAQLLGSHVQQPGPHMLPGYVLFSIACLVQRRARHVLAVLQSNGTACCAEPPSAHLPCLDGRRCVCYCR